MKEITIVCVAYKRYTELPILIHSFFCQTLQNYKLLIIHDGPDHQMSQLLAGYKSCYPYVFDYVITDTRYNDHGHSLRELGIKLADTEYILITNDDNYYCPRFLEFMFEPVKNQSADIVYCDMIHSYNNAGFRGTLPYSFFETTPERGSIDMGAFIAKTSMAKQVGFRDRTWCGDATYLEDLLAIKQSPVVVKVPQVLFIHN